MGEKWDRSEFDRHYWLQRVRDGYKALRFTRTLPCMLKVGNMIETDENGRFYRPVKISRTLNFLLNFEIPESDEKIYLEGADGENFACSLSKQFVKAALELVPSRQFKILSNEMMRSKSSCQSRCT